VPVFVRFTAPLSLFQPVRCEPGLVAKRVAVVKKVLRVMVALTSPAGPVRAVVQAAVVVEVAVETPAAAIILVRGDPGPGAVLTVGVEAPVVMEAVVTAMEVPPRLVRHHPLAVAAVGAVNVSATRLPMK